MKLTRKSRAVVLSNPIWKNDDIFYAYGFDTLYRQVQDIIEGCIRSFKAEAPWSDKQEIVNWVHVMSLYEHLPEHSTPLIQAELNCSEAQARRYMRAIKLATPFIKRIL